MGCNSTTEKLEPLRLNSRDKKYIRNAAIDSVKECPEAQAVVPFVYDVRIAEAQCKIEKAQMNRFIVKVTKDDQPVDQIEDHPAAATGKSLTELFETLVPIAVEKSITELTPRLQGEGGQLEHIVDDEIFRKIAEPAIEKEVRQALSTSYRHLMRRIPDSYEIMYDEEDLEASRRTLYTNNGSISFLEGSLRQQQRKSLIEQQQSGTYVDVDEDGVDHSVNLRKEEEDKEREAKSPVEASSEESPVGHWQPALEPPRREELIPEVTGDFVPPPDTRMGTVDPGSAGLTDRRNYQLPDALTINSDTFLLTEDSSGNSPPVLLNVSNNTQLYLSGSDSVGSPLVGMTALSTSSGPDPPQRSSTMVIHTSRSGGNDETVSSPPSNSASPAGLTRADTGVYKILRSPGGSAIEITRVCDGPPLIESLNVDENEEDSASTLEATSQSTTPMWRGRNSSDARRPTCPPDELASQLQLLSVGEGRHSSDREDTPLGPLPPAVDTVNEESSGEGTQEHQLSENRVRLVSREVSEASGSHHSDSSPSSPSVSDAEGEIPAVFTREETAKDIGKDSEEDKDANIETDQVHHHIDPMVTEN